MATPVAVLKSQTHYIADGTTTLWDFSFASGYLSKDHVRAYKRDPSGARTEIPLVASNFVTDTRLQITGVASGWRLVIYRATPTDGPLVDWSTASSIKRADLDTTAKQAVFVAAEASDAYGVTTERDLVDLATAAATAANTAATSATNASNSASAAAVSQAAAAAAAASVAVWRSSTIANTSRLGLNINPVPENMLVSRVSTSTHGADIVDAYQWQRLFDTPQTLWSGTRSCQRFLSKFGTTANDPMTIGTAWTVNAIADLASNVTTSESAVALSGVVMKNGKFQHAIGGHFQVRDAVDFVAAGTDVTPTVGTEMNLTCVGPDSAVANDGFGNRHCLTLYAYTNRAVAGGATPKAEIGSGIKIEPSQTDYTMDGKADFRNGIIVKDRWQYGGTSRVTQAGVRIETGGQHGLYIKGNHAQANITLADGSATYGQAAHGLVCSGSYSGSAIRVNAGQAIALDATNSVKMVYNPANSRIEFYSGGVVRGYIDMTGASHAL